MKDPIFIIYTFVYLISSTRARSIAGWMYPWLQWTYAYSENATSVEIEDHVSQILDVFGYLIFASPLFAILPELIVVIFFWIKEQLDENRMNNKVAQFKYVDKG